MPTIIIIAGPNGAGKTTFARQLINVLGWPDEAFLNADEVAKGLEETTNGNRDIAAARKFLFGVDAMVDQRVDFAIETTLATRRLARHIPIWQSVGYEVDLYYLKLRDHDLAIERVSQRVKLRGHDIPRDVICRRFELSGRYLDEIYRDIVDRWQVFDNSEGAPELILAGGRK